MNAGFELFDHTADVGVRAHAADFSGLVEPATNGLYAVIGELAAEGDTKRMEFTFEGDDPSTLLRDYLAELLFAFEQESLCATSVEVVEFSDQRLHVIGRMAPVNESQSEFHREVKAVTYHELKIQPIEGGYQATYIVDI